jgi:two-component system response regulator TctD
MTRSPAARGEVSIEPPAIQGHGTRASQAPLRTLWVDHGSLVDETLVVSLAGQGFRLELVPDASQALEFSRVEAYDVVLINADLEGVDGAGLSKSLRSEGCPSVIVLLSEDPTQAGHVAALSAGANDYLGKATPPGALIDRLRAHVAGSRIKSADLPFPVTAEVTSAAGVLTLSLTPTLVALDGRALMLTRVEEKLLARLWMGRGAVVSWDELAESIGIGRPVTPHTLRVHLSRLRRKLRKLGLVIEHVRGEGDRFCYTSHRIQQISARTRHSEMLRKIDTI